MGTVISAKVIADSINTQTGDRLTTVLATFPRCILAEVNTHRRFSGNTSSSLADRLKIATARAAHTSYTLVDGTPLDAMRAMTVYDKIVSADPLHASPLEHCAFALTNPDPRKSRNFDGFGQLRGFIEAGLSVDQFQE